MLTKGIVSYARSVVPLFALVLAVWSPAPIRAAAATYDNPVSQNAGTAVDRLLSVSVSEQTDRVSTVADVNEPVAVQSLVYTPDGGQESGFQHRRPASWFPQVLPAGLYLRSRNPLLHLPYIRYVHHGRARP